MKAKPSDTVLQTFYAGVRHGDSFKQLRHMLKINKRQLKYWMTIAEKAKKKQRKNYTLDDNERTCLRLKRLVDAAKKRR